MNPKIIHELNEAFGGITGFIFGIGVGCVAMLAIITVWGWVT